MREEARVHKKTTEEGLNLALNKGISIFHSHHRGAAIRAEWSQGAAVEAFQNQIEDKLHFSYMARIVAMPNLLAIPQLEIYIFIN